MATKYYEAQNAGRVIGGEQFEVTEIFGGTAFGVFAATTEAQQATLSKIAADPKSAVTEITEAEYQNALKKKAPSLSGFPTSTQSMPPVALKAAGVVVPGPVLVDRTELERLESVENALDVGKVGAEPVQAEAPRKPKK